MDPIPEEIVEKTWQEVAGFSPDRAKKEMMKIGNSQPELLAFVTESSQEMGQEVRELAALLLLIDIQSYLNIFLIRNRNIPFR
jgi:hypothetical protein